MAVKANLDNTIGAAFLGISVACILVGIAMVQTHSYYRNYPRDWVFQKFAVGVLMILAILHLGFTIHAIYFYLITNFGNPRGLAIVIWSFKLEVIFNTLMVIFVQGLYAMRVWKLGNHFSRFWPAVVGVVVAGGWGLGFVSIVNSFRQGSFIELGPMSKVIYSTFATSTGIDIVIATAMCYYLYRSRTSFSGTNNKIIIVMKYVLVSGFLTSACSLSTLISYSTMPNTLVFIGIGVILPNLYTNSYFAMLNARRSINEHEKSGTWALNIAPGGANSLRMTDVGISQHSSSVDDKGHHGLSKAYDPERDVSSNHEVVAPRMGDSERRE